MKCDICGHDSSKVTVIMGFGYVCSEDCHQIANGRIQAHHQKLREEPLETMPDALTTGDFEYWALKLAVHYIADISGEAKEKLMEAAPYMFDPETMSLELKDHILRHIPQQYVSSTPSRGHARMLCDATYCFRQPVPKQLVIDACKSAGILK